MEEKEGKRKGWSFVSRPEEWGGRERTWFQPFVHGNGARLEATVLLLHWYVQSWPDARLNGLRTLEKKECVNNCWKQGSLA